MFIIRLVTVIFERLLLPSRSLAAFICFLPTVLQNSCSPKRESCSTSRDVVPCPPPLLPMPEEFDDLPIGKTVSTCICIESDLWKKICNSYIDTGLCTADFKSQARAAEAKFSLYHL